MPKILLTPGPLTTSDETRAALDADWGSRDTQFIAMCKTVLEQLVAIVNGKDSHVCVPLQGSGTFAVEAAIGTIVPRNGNILVLVNGAYGRRIVQICNIIGRTLQPQEWAESQVTNPAEVDKWLAAHPETTHVAIVHCETSVGIENPLTEVAKVVEKHGKRLIVDAMSSFGALPIDVAASPAIDAVIAASGKCLEGVPGMGFVIARPEALLAKNAHSLVLDLQDQHVQMVKTSQWRFTPPTTVLAGLHSALKQFEAEGGQPARLARYTENFKVLQGGMRKLGFKCYVRDEVQAPIIVTFYAPNDPNWDFVKFYNLVNERGYVLYPGKLTDADTFRVGCIGDVQPARMQHAVNAIAASLKDMGIN